MKAQNPELGKDFEAIGSGLFCSVNRNVSLGDPWKTGDEKRSRPRKQKAENTGSPKKETKKPSIRRSNYEVQASYLPKLKEEKPELTIVNAFVLQKAVNNVDNAFQRFFEGKGAYPNYTRPHNQGFEFDPGSVKLDLKAFKIYLSGLGWVRFYNSRQWWDGIKIGKTTVSREADGFYVSILISDAAWYQLRQKIAHQSKKQGKKHTVVPSHHTSQECSECHHISADNRDGEKFICSECGYFGDADNNAGNNIGIKGIELENLSSSKVRLVRPEFTPQIRLGRNHLHGQVSRGTSALFGH